MNFVFTCTLLVLGSSLITFRISEKIRPFAEHLGIILMLYSAFKMVLFLFTNVNSIGEEPVFFMLKSGLWGLLLIIGYQLAYPVLERNLFSLASDLQSQGKLVFDGFNGVRIALGVLGFTVVVLLVLLQLGVY